MTDMELLLDCQSFEGLSEEELARLIEISEYQHLSKGEILFREHDESKNLYIVIEGCLGVRRHIIHEKDDAVPLAPVIAEHGAG